MTRTLEFSLNGSTTSVEIEGQETLLDLLRGPLGMNGPKYGCGKAQCGACTVLIEGVPARACILPAVRAGGHAVTTLEGLTDSETGALSYVQTGFFEKEGAQCGYCLNGMVMVATAYLAQNPTPTEAEVRTALRHNLCRCGTHKEIVASVMRAAELAGKGRDV